MSRKGDEILTRARAKFRELRVVSTLRKIEVPEWEATIYYWPVRSLEEKIGVGQYILVNGDQNGAHYAQVHQAQVCYRARDELGDRLFSDEDVKALADTYPAVVERISAEMGLGDDLDVEVAAKN